MSSRDRSGCSASISRDHRSAEPCMRGQRWEWIEQAFWCRPDIPAEVYGGARICYNGMVRSGRRSFLTADGLRAGVFPVRRSHQVWSAASGGPSDQPQVPQALRRISSAISQQLRWRSASSAPASWQAACAGRPRRVADRRAIVAYRPRLTTESTRPRLTSRAISHTLLARIATDDREPVSLQDVPLCLRQATIAIDDRPFYEHRESTQGIARAMW